VTAGRAAPGAVERDPGRVEAMFSAIARRYDLVNRLMTMGLDRRWRRLAAAEAHPQPGERVLDVCCGTGDLALALAQRCPSCAVVGLDFSEAMLDLARRKTAARAPGTGNVSYVRGDVLGMPFADDTFAAVTVAFGVRNVPDVRAAFAEMARVTRREGRVVCLEATRPRGRLGRRVHALWLGTIVPRLGRVVSGNAAAYSYLPASTRDFPDADGLGAVMAAAGLCRVRYRRFVFGIVALHVGEAAGSEASAGRDDTEGQAR
jgi:demethylmenaquinone methyltransferase/2-methoxy-6-polyprenyl-1,4-benzoquinol methylase